MAGAAAAAGVRMTGRVPSIRFRYVKSPSSPGAPTRTESESANTEASLFFASDVPAPPRNTAVGGKASLQPKRTPVSEKEIEAILLGGVF
uniref:Uncharacterized protein n=1 Tax=Kalanchoe fedtschenkoi TaxID=63787 RepID=A0A7N0RC19_KALFE